MVDVPAPATPRQSTTGTGHGLQAVNGATRDEAESRRTRTRKTTGRGDARGLARVVLEGLEVARFEVDWRRLRDGFGSAGQWGGRGGPAGGEVAEKEKLRLRRSGAAGCARGRGTADGRSGRWAGAVAGELQR